MAQKGPQVYALDGQLGNRVVISDAINGFIANGVATGSYTLGTVKRITNLKGAETLGINAAYDVNNKCLVHTMIKEYFRLQPDGILYFMLVADDQTQEDMVTTHWPALLTSEEVWDNERINEVALKRNVMDDEYEADLEEGYWDETIAALDAWQAANDALETIGIYPGVLIVDGSYSGAYGAYTNLRAKNVAGCVVCVGQDPQVALTNEAHANYADTGAMLGLFAQRKAAESIGALQVENPPAKYRAAKTVSMVDTLALRWLTTALSNGTVLSTLTPAEIATLNGKGVCYFDGVHNYAGVYGVNNGTTIEATSDYAWPERYRILQKAKHLAYQYFVVYKEKVVDLENSKLAASLVKYMENEATNAVLGQLRFENNISEYEGVDGAGVFLPQDYNFVTGEHESDPGQNTTAETLKVRVAVPIRGILRNIEIFVGLKA